VRTVQGDVENALGRLFTRAARVACAGRTDAGVHALGQVVSTPDADADVDVARLKRALNGMCGPSIAVTRCTRAPDDFHARFSARSRTYVYAILDGDTPHPLLARTTHHHREVLDVEAMNEAAGHLVGAHDFSSFGRVAEPGASAQRLLFELACRRAGRIVTVRARANAFLQQMVRTLVGTLLEVGAATRSPDDVVGVLAGRDRSAAGPVAPPHGLCLVSVEYDDGWSRPATEQ
jgi:tRNA pseudouridine38-40 synthase